MKNKSYKVYRLNSFDVKTAHLKTFSMRYPTHETEGCIYSPRGSINWRVIKDWRNSDIIYLGLDYIRNSKYYECFIEIHNPKGEKQLLSLAKLFIQGKLKEEKQ